MSRPFLRFPLSPVELQRWTRFAQKGGIGRARARVDKVSQDAAKDLMFLEGDDIVVLMELGAATYLVRRRSLSDAIGERES